MIRPGTFPVASADCSFKPSLFFDSFARRFQGCSDGVGFAKPGRKVRLENCARAFREDSQGDASHFRTSAHCAKNWNQGEGKNRPKWAWKSQTGRRLNKTYPERVQNILNFLQEWPDSEIEHGLDEWKGQLQATEQAIVLNKQISWARALRIFSWLKTQDDYVPNVFHYNIMLKILGRAQKLELVEKLWKEMEEKKVTPTNVSYSTLIDTYGRFRNPEKALEWLEDMKRRGLEPDEVTVNTLVNLHKQSENVDAAEAAFNSSSRNVENYNTMLDLYGRVGRYADASRIFSEMNEAGICADNVTFNTMIKVCGLARRSEEAEALFVRMQENGLSPDVATFNVLLAVFLKVGMIQKSLQYFHRMKDTGIVPDVVTFETLLSALSLRDMVSEAEATAKEMAQLGFRTGEAVGVGLARMYIRVSLSDKAAEVLKSYGSTTCLSTFSLAAVIDSYAGEGLWREAEELFLGCQQGWGIENFNTMVKVYGLAGLHEKAWEFFSSMEEKGVSPDGVTHNSIIHLLSTASSPDLEKVDRVRSDMQKKGYELRRSSFNVLISTYGKLGKVEEAQETFEQMEASGVAPDEISYGALVNAYAEVGDAKRAQLAAIAMSKAGFIPNRILYTTLMKLYGKMNKIEEVKKTYTDMGRAGVGPDIFATNFLIYQYGKGGKVQDAERILRDLEEGNGEVSVDEVTLSVMLDMYKKFGLIQQALGMAKRMLNMDGLKDIVSYNSILGLYANLGRVSQAMEVFQSLSSRNVEPDMTTYSIMSYVMKKIGSFQEAIDLMATATSSGDSLTVQSLTTLVSIYARAGKAEEALRTCEQVLHGGLTFDNPLVNAMIYAHGMAGRHDEAMRLFTEMQSHGLQPDVVTYTTLITIYGRAGILENVTRIFKRMKQTGCAPSDATYKVVIQFYKDAGKAELAAMVQQERQFARYIREELVHEAGSYIK